MALPTKAQWIGEWYKLSYFQGLGQLLANQAHIFRAFSPIGHDRATIKVNWTDGAGAGQVAETAGTPQSASVAPAQVDDTFTKEYAAQGSQALDAFDGQSMSVGFEAQQSASAAIAAIYNLWVKGLIGSGTGVNKAIWGIEDFITVAATAGSTMSKTETTAANLLKSIDFAVTALPASGFNICLTDSEGYNAVKALIRSLGGVASNEVKTEAFGAEFLTFSGVTFFWTHQMEGKGTSPLIDTQYNFFNIGPEGTQLVVPNGMDPFLIQGPKETKGEFDKVFDIALRSQIIYTSPRAAFKLTQRIDT